MNGRIAALLTLLLAAGLAGTVRGGVVEKIRDVGPDENRLVIVLVAEGYLGSQETQFFADARQAMDGLLAETPYREYAAYVNAYADFVPSNEQGADKPAPCFGTPVEKDTAFDATYCTGGTRRLLTVRSGPVFTMVNEDVPTVDLVAVIVNDPEYGGAGGSLLTFSTDAGAMIELFLHEAGHTFGRLADEYVSYMEPYAGGEPRERNVTIDLDLATTKWTEWIEPGTPVPTPAGTGGVGLFEGARYYESGIYRPISNCKMRTLNRSFCPVCNEGHVQQLYLRVSPVDGATPPEGPVEVSPCETFELTVVPMQPSPQTLVAEWLLDGEVLPGETGFSLSLDPAQLTGGAGTVVARLRDATELVRDPYATDMEGQATWFLSSPPGSDLDGDGLDDACDPDLDGDDVPNDLDCAPSNPAVSEPVGEVDSLRVRRAPTGEAVLSWDDRLGDEGRSDGAYALVTGLLSDLHRDRGFAQACRLAGDGNPELRDARALSADGWYYLVQAADGCGPGSVGASVPVSRDARAALLSSPPADCP